MEKLAELLQAILEEIREIKVNFSSLNEKFDDFQARTQTVDEDMHSILLEVKSISEDSTNLWKTIGDTVGGELHHNMKDLHDLLSEIASKLT